jgi:hypothetical protein
VDQVPDLLQQIESLDTWGRWARGDTTSIQQRGDAVTHLTNVDRWTSTHTGSKRWAKRYATGPTTPTLSFRPSHGTADRSSEPVSKSGL